MNYLKGYKKSRKIPKFSKILLCVIFLYIVYEIIDINSNKIKSDDLNKNMNAQTIIENACNTIVGISREYGTIEGNNKIWGSGIIVSNNGYVLTNEHISGALGSFCYVIVDYNKNYKASVVWSNAELDLAILKVNCNFENHAILGDSSKLKIGQQVYSIGNPISMSFQKSVGSGIVSGLNRNLEFEENGKKFYINNLIQTDAVINPGNSGGALINEQGELIGINTMKFLGNGIVGIGFAIPVSSATEIINQSVTGVFEQKVDLLKI